MESTDQDAVFHIRLLLVGDIAVGKSATLTRFADNLFLQEPTGPSTISDYVRRLKSLPSDKSSEDSYRWSGWPFRQTSNCKTNLIAI
jgi:GTPase SAR1 family protein